MKVLVGALINETVKQYILFATTSWNIERRKLPVHVLIYGQVIFDRHSGMADNFTGETVNSKDMGHPEHHHLSAVCDPCTRHCMALDLSSLISE